MPVERYNALWSSFGIFTWQRMRQPTPETHKLDGVHNTKLSSVAHHVQSNLSGRGGGQASSNSQLTIVNIHVRTGCQGACFGI